MEMMNRAIEDASDFMDMKRKLMAKLDEHRDTVQKTGAHEMLDDMQKMEIAPQQQSKRPGENREQYRARIHGKVKS
jgi:hypothetical protein